MYSATNSMSLTTPLIHPFIKELRRIHAQCNQLNAIAFSFKDYKTRTEYIIALIKQTLELERSNFEIVMNEGTLTDIISAFVKNKRHAQDFDEIRNALCTHILLHVQTQEHKNYIIKLLSSLP